jgi:S1-C subfamily serine protease
VVADSPAKAAGLVGSGTDSTGDLDSDGDVITAIDGKSVTSVEDILNYINTKKVGDVVTLKVVRGGNAMDVSITLATRPADISSVIIPDTTPAPNSRGSWFDRWPFNLLPTPED